MIREFMLNARSVLDAHRGCSYCVLAIDIERFKVFNEWHGYEAGDAFLERLEELVSELAMHNEGYGCRIQDDDYACILPNDNKMLNRITKRILDFVKEQGEDDGFLPSFGVYVIGDNEMDVRAMYDRAQIAMKSNSANGKSRISYFQDEMFLSMENDHLLQREVQKAVKNHEFCFYLQPQVNMRNNKIIGAEALVRWNHREKGMISPGKFIPFLEENGYIVELDKYVWEEVCKWQGQLLEKGIRPVPVSVNVSRLDIFFLDVPQFFKEMFAKYGISSSTIEVEITESAYMQGYEEILSTVHALQEMGIKILMDDFGSGYSSLNMLRNVSIDVLKSDMEFLSINGEMNRKGMGILESVVDMVRFLGVPMIAEGVETQQQVDALLDMGCAYAQGFYYYKPMPAAQFEKIIMNPEQVDYAGAHNRQTEQLHIREFLDDNLFSDTMVNNILGAIAFFEMEDEKVSIVRMNEQYYRLTGLDEADGGYRTNFINYIMADDRGRLYEALQEARNSGLNAARCDIRYLKPDATILYLHIRLFFLHEKEGKQMFYGAVSDATKRLESQRKLNNALFALDKAGEYADELTDNVMRRLLNGKDYAAVKALEAQMSRGGILAFRVSDSTLYYADDDLMKYLGFADAEEMKRISNNYFFNMVLPEDVERMQTELEGNNSPGAENTLTFRLFRRDKSYFWALAHCRMVKTNVGPVYWMIIRDISDSMEAQSSLTERNEFLMRQNETLRFINQELPGGYFRCEIDKGFPFEYVSDIFIQMFGYSTFELKALFDNQLVNMIHPEDRRRVTARLKKEARSGYSNPLEFRIQSIDGYKWVWSQGHTVLGDRPIYHGMMVDITENILLRKEMETMAKQMENLVRLENINSWEWIMETGELKLIDVMFANANEWVNEKLETEGSTIKGFPDAFFENDIVPKKYQDLLRAYIKRVNRQKTAAPFFFEIPFKKKGGRQIWLRIKGSPVFDDTGTVCRVIGSYVDVTKEVQKRLENKRNLQEYSKRVIAAEADKLEAIASSNTNKAILVGVNRMFLTSAYINLRKNEIEFIKQNDDLKTEGLTDMGHYEEYIEEYIRRFVHRDDRAMVREQVTREYIASRLSKENPHFEVTYRRKKPDMTFRWYRMTFIMSTLLNDLPEYVILNYSDVEEEVHKEKEYEKKLQVAVEAKTHFLSNMSHDIRTPMNGIIGMTAVAKADLDDKKKVAECLDKIDISSKYLLNLVNDVLDLNNIESRNLELKEEPVSLEEIINSLSTVMGQLADSKKQRFVVSTQNLVHKEVVADELRLIQIFSNILNNAMKYTPEGGNISWSITELQKRRDGKCEYKFVISDDGVGMDRKQLSHIYDSYMIAKKDGNGNLKSVGLGMPITHHLVMKMGGTMQIKSAPGEGSTFTLVLPLATQKQMNLEEFLPKDVDNWEEDEHFFDGMHILVAEDNLLNMEIITEILEEKGILVTPAENGQEALNIFMKSQEGFFDAILMDIQMPVMNGYEASRSIRASQHPDADDIRIIAVSADAFAQDVEKALDAGMDAHIAKPIEYDLLFRELEKTREAVKK